MSSLRKSVKSFFSYVFSPKNLERDARYEIKSRFYSPEQDESMLSELSKKIAKGRGRLAEPLVYINRIAMRLNLYYLKEEDFLKAAKVARQMSYILTKSLKRAKMGEISFEEKEASQLRTLARYWKRVAFKSAKEPRKREAEMRANAESYILEGRYDEAIKVLQVVLETKTNDKTEMVNIIRTIAKAIHMKGDYSKELVYLETAAKIDPQTWFDVGLLLGEMTRYEESISAYKKFLNHSPKNASALSNMGLGFYRLGKPNEAKKAFEDATEIDPNFIDPLLGLSSLCSDVLHDYNTAAYYAKRALDLNPDDLLAIANTAEIMVLAGQYDVGRDQAKKVLELDDTPFRRIAMYFTISVSYFLEGRAEEGKKNLDVLMDYRKSLPQTFTNSWNYDGIFKVITESNIQEDWKEKLIQTINDIPQPWFKSSSA